MILGLNLLKVFEINCYTIEQMRSVIILKLKKIMVLLLIIYLSIYGAIILWMYTIFRMIKSYNPILTLIKIVESLIISYVLGFAIFLIGLWFIGIFAVISVFGIAISIRSAEVRRY